MQSICPGAQWLGDKEYKEKDGSAQKIGRLFGSLAIQIMKIQKTKLY